MKILNLVYSAHYITQILYRKLIEILLRITIYYQSENENYG